MPVTTKNISLVAVAIGALVVIAIALIGISAGYLTNPAEPIRAQIALDETEQGPQGAFAVNIYRCWDDTGTPAAPDRPTGGSYVLATGLVDSLPTGWAVESSSPACVAPETRFGSAAEVNPALQTGSATLAWGPPVRVQAAPSVTVQDEGTVITTSAGTINFVGAGVTVTESGGVVTITID